MPEMPEVETVVRTLNNLVINKQIISVELLVPKMLKNVSYEEFSSALINSEIDSIDRYAKYIFINLSSKYTLISHLRMEGKYNFSQESTKPEKHDAALFHFTDGTKLAYNDTRKFGTFDLVKTNQKHNYKSIAKLGPEANNYSGLVKIIPLIRSKNRKIKEVLLDQTIMAGLGNIYVDEVLFKAKVHPEQVASTISVTKMKQIMKISCEIMEDAIKAGGTTVKSFTISGGATGLFQYNLNVYGRANEPCRICQTPISKIKVGGRGTHFCTKCQKVKK
jgi:formamidopyrimidine-DNA glycosylase